MAESQDEELLLQIVEEIEHTWIDPSDAEFPQLVEILTERQRHLIRIQDFDVSQLRENVREELRLRLEHILRRDQELRNRVDVLRESLVKQANELRLTRRGAEGYARATRPVGPGFDRTA